VGKTFELSGEILRGKNTLWVRRDGITQAGWQISFWIDPRVVHDDLVDWLK